jgi:NADH-quinone oxidoreductase subunit C
MNQLFSSNQVLPPMCKTRRLCVAEAFDAVGLRERIERDLPGTLVATPRRVDVPATPVKKGESVRPNFLATDDPVIVADRLPDVARYLRQTLGYELLTNVTATDYLADGVIEVVYHFVCLNGGAPVAIKVRTGREQPEVPSLIEEWPGAAFQEREAFDLYGVVFRGHSNLRRIYMWDEFEGFPMRKDFPKQGDKYFGDVEE